MVDLTDEAKVFNAEVAQELRRAETKKRRKTNEQLAKAFAARADAAKRVKMDISIGEDSHTLKEQSTRPMDVDPAAPMARTNGPNPFRQQKDANSFMNLDTASIRRRRQIEDDEKYAHQLQDSEQQTPKASKKHGVQLGPEETPPFGAGRMANMKQENKIDVSGDTTSASDNSDDDLADIRGRAAKNAKPAKAQKGWYPKPGHVQMNLRTAVRDLTRHDPDLETAHDAILQKRRNVLRSVMAERANEGPPIHQGFRQRQQLEKVVALTTLAEALYDLVYSQPTMVEDLKSKPLGAKDDWVGWARFSGSMRPSPTPTSKERNDR